VLEVCGVTLWLRFHIMFLVLLTLIPWNYFKCLRCHLLFILIVVYLSTLSVTRVTGEWKDRSDNWKGSGRKRSTKVKLLFRHFLGETHVSLSPEPIFEPGTFGV
jgi:hypothetical protein